MALHAQRPAALGAVYQQAQRWLSGGRLRGTWPTTCARCCAWPPGAGPSRRRSSWTADAAVDARERRPGRLRRRQERKGSKVHVAVDTLGHLLALHVTPADEQERAQVGRLAEAVQEATGDSVELAYVDQGYTGEEAGHGRRRHGIELDVVKLPEAKRGFVLLPRRWVVERSFAWAARFRRLARDYERLPETLAAALLAFACLMLARFVKSLQS